MCSTSLSPVCLITHYSYVERYTLEAYFTSFCTTMSSWKYLWSFYCRGWTALCISDLRYFLIWSPVFIRLSGSLTNYINEFFHDQRLDFMKTYRRVPFLQLFEFNLDSCGLKRTNITTLNNKKIAKELVHRELWGCYRSKVVSGPRILGQGHQ